MGSKQRVAVSDIVKTLFATNQQTITKEKAVQLFDQVFRQAKEADRVLDDGMAHPSRSISPSRPSKRRKTTSTPQEIIRCICASLLDNGSPWICCEGCSAWQHMNCMHLHWTAAEAEKHKYLCERCAPAQHWDVVGMLEGGTWEPLPVRSAVGELGGWEEEGDEKQEIKEKEGVRGGEINVKIEPEEENALPVSKGMSIHILQLRQQLQYARSDGDHALAARIAADIRKLQQLPANAPPLQKRRVSDHSSIKDLDASPDNKDIANINPLPTTAAGSSALGARDRRHCLNGGVGVEFLLPANVDSGGAIDDKGKERAQEGVRKEAGDPVIQQLGKMAAQRRER